MLLAEAMSGYCALTALENLIGREKVLEFINEEPVTFREFPQDETYLLKLRQKVNKAIAENGIG